MNFSRRLLAPAFIGFLAAALYGALNFYKYNATGIEVNEFYGEQFFAVIATLYAIITALILVKGIESFDSLGGAINQEAMKLRSINAFFYYFAPTEQLDGGAKIEEMKRLLIHYATNVIDQKTALRSTKNDMIIDDCVRLSAGISVVDENDRVAITEIMRGLDDLRKLRATRVNVAQEKIPGYLIGMLALMTVSIMIPFYLLHQTGLSFNYYIIFTLAMFGSFIFFLLNDVNKPYEGLWKIDLSPFEEARSEISRSVTELA